MSRSPRGRLRTSRIGPGKPADTSKVIGGGHETSPNILIVLHPFLVFITKTSRNVEEEQCEPGCWRSYERETGRLLELNVCLWNCMMI